MVTKEEMQAKMEAGLAKADANIQKMKAKMDEAGDAASDEAREALADAERMWEKGKAKLDELADASDEQYEEMKAAAEKNWDELSASLESGWANITEKFKSFFS